MNLKQRDRMLNTDGLQRICITMILANQILWSSQNLDFWRMPVFFHAHLGKLLLTGTCAFARPNPTAVAALEVCTKHWFGVSCANVESLLFCAWDTSLVASTRAISEIFRKFRSSGFCAKFTRLSSSTIVLC